MGKIMTISVDEKAETLFRRKAYKKFGRRKGSLGKALSQAMAEWAKKEEYNPDAHMLQTMGRGLDLGGIKVKKRSAWHER